MSAIETIRTRSQTNEFVAAVMSQTSILPALLWLRDRPPEHVRSIELSNCIMLAIEELLGRLARGACGCAIVNPTIPDGGVTVPYLRWSPRLCCLVFILETTHSIPCRRYLCFGNSLATGFMESEELILDSSHVCDGTCRLVPADMERISQPKRVATDEAICLCALPAWYCRVMTTISSGSS